jgi:carbonic anhydrase
LIFISVTLLVVKKESRGHFEKPSNMFGVDHGNVPENEAMSTVEEKQSSFHWGYEKYNGPCLWGDYFPLASYGRRQSPCDLPGGVKGKVEKTNSGEVNRQPIAVADSYRDSSAEGKLNNNGHTVQFAVGMPNNFTIKEGPFGDEEYQFLQLHFHWGSIDSQGSEHTMNGKRFPMEMHMVHVNSRYVKPDGTLDSKYQSSEDGLAVLGFMFELGDDDCTMLESITSGITALSETRESETIAEHPVNIQLSLGAFLTPSFQNGYYTYSGSLTTPEFNEIVTWVVFKETTVMSKKQIASFRSLKDNHGNTMCDNFRPTQPLNDRLIENGEDGRLGDNCCRLS